MLSTEVEIEDVESNIVGEKNLLKCAHYFPSLSLSFFAGHHWIAFLI